MRHWLTILILATWATLAQAQTQTVTISITFQDNSDNETGFELERCTGAGCINFVKVKDLPINAPAVPSTVSLTDVIANDTGGVTYCYRVRAVNSAGASAYSNTACGTSKVIIVIPPAPSNLTIPNITTSSVDLQWKNESTTLTEIRIEGRRSGQAYGSMASLAGSMEGLKIAGLKRNSSYNFRIRACQEINCSGYATFPTVKTLK